MFRKLAAVKIVPGTSKLRRRCCVSTSLRILVVAVTTLWAVTSTAQTPLAGGGWTNASPTDSDLSEAKLRSMSAAIRSDQFKKIGSVLIARHGKLAYEDYVDGDENSLRD